MVPQVKKTKLFFIRNKNFMVFEKKRKLTDKRQNYFLTREIKLNITDENFKNCQLGVTPQKLFLNLILDQHLRGNKTFVDWRYKIDTM